MTTAHSQTVPISLSTIIPVYNSKKTAKKQLERCQEILSSLTNKYEILICDDQSTDGTADIIRQLPSSASLRCFFHTKNLGIAPTLRELYNRAKYDYIIVFSIDGDWNPEDISHMVHYAYRYHADIVIGQRKKDDYTRYRKVISTFYNMLPAFLFGISVYDAGSIKVVRNEVYKHVSILSTSVFFEAELIMKAQRKGYLVLPYQFVSYTKKIKSSGLGGKPSYVLHAFWDLLCLRVTGL